MIKERGSLEEGESDAGGDGEGEEVPTSSLPASVHDSRHQSFFHQRRPTREITEVDEGFLRWITDVDDSDLRSPL